MKFPSIFFTQNRARLIEKMDNDSLLVLCSNDQYPKNGDQKFVLRQQSDLYYLTGITQEETALLIYKNKQAESISQLLILKPNLKLETWEGKKLTKTLASEISGIVDCFWNTSLDRNIKACIEPKTKLYLLGKDAFAQTTDLNTKHLRLLSKLKKQNPKNKIESPRLMINQLRLVKSEEEIQMMQKAVDITNEAYKRVLSTTKVGMNEFEVEAEISYVFRKAGANGHAYDPIIATGVNACSLHYIKNDDALKDQDLLLMDFGADCSYYAADLSRTIPVNGKFTERQKQLYNLVLEVQKKSISLFVPGNTIDIVNAKTKQWMKEALLAIDLLKEEADLMKYFPHGTSHFLGIDVHDVGSKDIVFVEGMVLTCEPGVYVEEEGIGIRIENDIVVGKQPIDLMANTIREVEDIEQAMQA